MNDTLTDEPGSLYSVINISYDILIVLCLATFVPAYILIYSYFNSVSLDKECLLIHLYKDVISSLLLWRAFWVAVVITKYWNKKNQNETQAFIVSFGLFFVAGYLALILIFISIYKLYMSKTKTVDPTIAWLGKDEALVAKKIRLGCILVVICFLATTFGMELYPRIYHYMLLHEPSSENVRMPFILYRCTFFLLLLISGVLTVASKFYGKIDGVIADNIILKTVKYVFIVCCVSGIVGLFVDSFQIYDKRTSKKIYQIFLSLIKIFSPYVLIYKSEKLKTHSIRYLKNLCDDIFMLNIYFIPIFLSIVMYSSLYIMF